MCDASALLVSLLIQHVVVFLPTISPKSVNLASAFLSCVEITGRVGSIVPSSEGSNG